MAECEVCGRNFEAQRSTARYCGAACRKKASRARANPDDLRAKADELVAEQKKARGVRPHPAGAKIDGKPVMVLGPYVPTEENEARAAEILRLRRLAGRIEHPLAGDAPIPSSE